MGQTTNDMRSEIELTRQDMGVTLDAIGERVSPGRIVERRKARVRNSLRSAREAVMGTTDVVTDRARYTAGGIAEAGASAGTRAGSAAQDTLGNLTSGAGSAVESVQQAPAMARQRTSGNPLAAGLVAFGGGLLLASIAPPSEPEQRVAGPVMDALDPVAEQARSVGSEMTQELSSSASRAAEGVKGTATEAAEQVRSEATTAGEQVKDEAASAAERLRDQGQAGVENVRQQSGQ